MRRALRHVARSPQQPRPRHHAGRVAQPPEKQRQHAEQGGGGDFHVPGLSQIGGQPRDVEIPAVGEAEILPADHPHLPRAQKPAPGHVAMAGGQLGAFPQQVALGRVELGVLQRVVDVPSIKHDGPDHSQTAENLERVAPSHQPHDQRHQRRGECAAPPRAEPHDALRAHSLSFGQPGGEGFRQIRESSPPHPCRTGNAWRRAKRSSRPIPWRR